MAETMNQNSSNTSTEEKQHKTQAQKYFMFYEEKSEESFSCLRTNLKRWLETLHWFISQSETSFSAEPGAGDVVIHDTHHKGDLTFWDCSMMFLPNIWEHCQHTLCRVCVCWQCTLRQRWNTEPPAEEVQVFVGLQCFSMWQQWSRSHFTVRATHRHKCTCYSKDKAQQGHCKGKKKHLSLLDNKPWQKWLHIKMPVL